MRSRTSVSGNLIRLLHVHSGGIEFSPSPLDATPKVLHVLFRTPTPLLVYSTSVGRKFLSKKTNLLIQLPECLVHQRCLNRALRLLVGISVPRVHQTPDTTPTQCRSHKLTPGTDGAKRWISFYLSLASLWILEMSGDFHIYVIKMVVVSCFFVWIKLLIS